MKLALWISTSALELAEVAGLNVRAGNADAADAKSIWRYMDR